jgi:hypothetical protein
MVMSDTGFASTATGLKLWKPLIGGNMKDETRYLLDDLLREWHKWAETFTMLGSHTVAPMFNGYSSSRQYDSESDVLDGSLHGDQMRAVNFHIEELEPIQRTAICINARNLHTGKSVWISARLPDDIQMRQEILAVARNNLLKRLQSAGML